MREAKFAPVLPGDKRGFALSAMGMAATLALMLAAQPWIVRASNSILATISAVSFAADSSFGVSSFPEADAASTGYISIPSARALLHAPRWKSTAAGLAPLAPRPGDRRMALAVVGMPIDAQNLLLKDRVIEQACLEDDGKVDSCNTQDKLFERIKYGKHLNLCDFDEECWHSTAATVVAIGSGSANPFAMPEQQSFAAFKTTTFAKIAHQDWKDFSETVVRSKAPTFQQFLTERFPDFAPVLQQSVEVATVGNPGNAEASAYVTPSMLVNRGQSPGTPLIAISVFRGYGGDACHAQQRADTCILTSTAAQESALRYLIERLDHGSSSGLLPAAVVLIAGGELVAGPCADAPIARLIGDLRRRGVVTFVAAGNDGKADQVRFPACAPDAVAVGSLRRDGTVADFGNGFKTGLVSLFADGEVVALPLRGPRIAAEPFAGVDPESCGEEGGCKLRDAANQYDAYLAGGTLLSAAAVSGMFLDLYRHYDDLPADAVVSALKAGPAVAGAAAPEADETRAVQWLEDYRRHHIAPVAQPAKHIWRGSVIFPAIALMGGLALVWRLRRRTA